MAKTIKATGLDAILAELAEDKLEPGEFTARDAYEAHRKQGGTRTFESVRKMLIRMAERGELISRLIRLGGTAVFAYRSKS